MEIKLVLSSEKILNKVFPGSTRGYDALVVDEFLDEILKDYRTVETNALIASKELESLKLQIQDLTKQKRNLEIENAKFKARLGNIKEGDTVSTDNIELVRRINALEKFLFQKGFNLNDIK